MRHNIKSILPIIAAVILAAIMAVSCGHRPTRDALERADALIDEHEDSALAVLQAIDTTRLSGRRDHALYGLLMTQALVKLHRPVTSDSLIAPAARYFAASSDRHHAMRALYYHGVVKYDNEQYPAAMVQFFRARDIATDLNNHFWAGLACRGISDTYNRSYNKAEELLYAEKEYKHFIESGRALYIRYAALDLARAHCSYENYDQSRAILKNLIDTAVSANDDYLLYSATQVMALSFFAEDRHEDALRLYKSVCAMPDASADDSLYLALSYIGVGDLRSADNIVAVTKADDDNLNKYYTYKYCLRTNQWREAIKAREQFDSVGELTYKYRARQTLQSVVADDLIRVKNEIKSNLRNAKNNTYALSIGAILVIIALTRWYFRQLRRHRQQTEEKVILAERLEEELLRSDAAYQSSQNKMKQLLSSNYSMIEQLCRVVAETSMTKSYNQKVASIVTQLIKDLKVDGEKKQELIDSANALYNNIYDDFITDIPNIKPIDYNIFLYSIHGFSTIEIMFLINEEKATTIYSRRRNLKNRIKLLPKEKSARYLAVFR